MKPKFHSTIRHMSLLSAAMIVVAPALAFAQETTTPDQTAVLPQTAGAATTQTSEDKREIVVTGTSLRKVAPAGAEEINLYQAAILATGATSTDQLLATIPQLSSFGTILTSNVGGDQLTVNRTNIRGLPQGVGGGSPTLVLMDGHRLVGEGVLQSYPDPDIIPPALIERVDVLTDGGSAIYGADAVGGVINFVTKRDFDGIDIGGRQGVGADFHSNDLNVTAGKKWNGGGFYIGYNHSDHSAIYGYDRDYIKNLNYTTGLPAFNYCAPGNVVVGGTNYAANSGNPLKASNANLCDNSKTAAFYPRENRDSVMAGFHQELSSNLDFEVKGYYSQRHDTQDGGPNYGSATLYGTAVPASPGFPRFGIPPTAAIAITPGYIPASGNPGATETAYFNFAGIPNGNQIVTTRLQSWGITPTLTWKMPHDWQMKAYYNYGGSKTTANDPAVNQTALSNAVQAGTINPYNVAASNPAALANVLDYTVYGVGKDTLNNGKVTFDGPLFRLPGGQIRLAVGGEWSHEKFEGTTGTDTYENAAIAPLNVASRNVEAGFGELNLPIVSRDNHVPLIYSLSVSLAERYDHYSDFGGNWAPNIGATWKPVSWISLRGRWNRSFQAPSLVNLANAATPSATVYPNIYTTFDAALVDPFLANNGGSIVAVQGTKLPLQPERARDYNLGIDISPPITPGLNIHFSYYNINYSGQIGTPPLGYGIFFGVPTFDNLLLTNGAAGPTTAQLTTFLQNAGVSATTITNTLASLAATGGKVYYAADDRTLNLGVSKVDGFDIAFDYHHETSFGSLYASLNSSYNRTAKNAADGIDFTGNQAGIDGPRFNSVAIVGATISDNFRAQLTWNHRASYTLSTAAALGQTTVGQFNTFDLYTEYTIKHAFAPLTFSIGVTNLFDQNPPVYYGDNAAAGGAGYANGSTIGRVVQFGANVKF